MPHTVTIKEAALHLEELVANLSPGDEITLTSKDQPVAKIVPAEIKPIHRRPGAAKGMLHILKEDEEHLEDFKEYMQ